MTTHTTATVAVPLTSAQLEEMLAAVKAQEAEEAAMASIETDKYHTSGEYIELPVKMVQPLLKEWHAAKAEADKAKERLEAAKTALSEAMAHHEVLVVEETGQMVVESRVSVGMVLDTSKLRKEAPDIAAKYQRERRSRSFRVLV